MSLETMIEEIVRRAEGSCIDPIPQTTLETIQRYILEGADPGDFGRAILENNLVRSFACADIHNRRALYSIAAYLYTEIPHAAWGSPEKVDAWIINTRKRRKEEKDEKEKAEKACEPIKEHV